MDIGLFGESFLLPAIFHLVSKFGVSIFSSDETHPVLNIYPSLTLIGFYNIIFSLPLSFSL